MKVTVTHSGWFGLLPVFYADIDKETPTLVVRYFLPDFLLDMQAGVYNFLAHVADWLSIEVEEGFPMMVTKTVKPFNVEVPE